MKHLNILLGVVALCGVTSGLQCYSCESPFPEDQCHTAGTNHATVTCASGENYCVSLYFEAAGETFGVRACKTTNLCDQSVTFKSCNSCTTDLCNTAAIVVP
ncbi:uncharacterized protein LOC116169618 [Photinus pyralis]|uniref:uncharacterized protein LOC116169618 n=1 Tax=Photinus pyralis TaxID=7054 RepID=UPI00126737F5|nr:uncharacterized protein LOC116169618 [Photinus pyralis]